MGTTVTASKDVDPSFKLPKLLDHPEYAACVGRITELKAKLADANSEYANYAGEPRGVDAETHDDADVEEAVSASEKLIEAHLKARKKAQIRRDAVARALDAEESRVPELRRQAEELVGRSAADQHSAIEEEVLTMRARLGPLFRKANAIRQALIAEINQQTEGYVSFTQGERFVRPIPHLSGGGY
jgi:hypothetical protein